MTKQMYCPPDAVLNNITRGNVLKQKYPRESIKSKQNSENITKAKLKFDNEGFTLENVMLMNYELTKLEKSANPLTRLQDGGPTEELLKFYSFGGHAGLAWTDMILKKNTKVTANQTTDQISSIPVLKSKNNELMQATFVAMVPDEPDSHGDITSVEDVRKACHNFNQHSMQANLFHLVKTDSFTFAESYIIPVDVIIEDNLIKAGTWLVVIQCLDEKLWELIKSGDICGVSIGAMANVEELEKEDE